MINGNRMEEPADWLGRVMRSSVGHMARTTDAETPGAEPATWGSHQSNGVGGKREMEAGPPEFPSFLRHSQPTG